MKKTIITGLLLVGAVSFANTVQPVTTSATTPTGNAIVCPVTGTQMRTRDGKNFAGKTGMNMKVGKKGMNKNGMDGRMNLTPEQRTAVEKNRIAIQEKRLEVRKALLEKSPDWKKIEKLNQESATIMAKSKTEMMKLRFEAIKARETQAVKTN